MGLAWSRRWICDDAFISFRYAQNFAAGHGLVFNLGERVEGYSNFSWTLLCALAQWLGADMEAFAQGLGIACFGALVPVTAWAGARLLPGNRAFLPLAAVGVALHQHLQDFASCGLETLGFVLLVTATVGVLAGADRPRSFAIASLLTVLAALTRPDGAIVGAAAGLAAVVASLRQRSLAPALAFAVPGFVLFVPFLAWRFLYYEDLLPNTFYAKSGNDPYPSQGWFYVQLFLNGYWVLWPAAVVLPALLPWRRAMGALPVVAAMALVYLAFVVWVGGDFMFARFCLPVTPLLYLVLEGMTRRFLAGSARWAILIAVALGTLLWHERQDLLVTGQAVQGVADERAQYPPERVAAIRECGRRLRGVPAKVAFSGTQAMLVYDARVPYALEAVTGLTDRFLAHRPVGERGHIGHEKGLFRSVETIEYGLRTQGVHLLLFDWPEQTKAYPFLAVQCAGFAFTMVRWDRAVMAKLLAQPDVVATDFEKYLDDYLRDLDSKPVAQVRADFAAFELVYFRWPENNGAVRKAKITAWLAGK
jgi:hypothetical protein